MKKMNNLYLSSQIHFFCMQNIEILVPFCHFSRKKISFSVFTHNLSDTYIQDQHLRKNCFTIWMKNKVQILEFDTFWLISVEFISETIRDGGNM